MRLKRSLNEHMEWIGFNMTITFDLYATLPDLKDRADRFNEIMNSFMLISEKDRYKIVVESQKIGEMKLSNVSEKATIGDIEKIREICEEEYRKKLPKYDIKIKWSGNINKE